MVHTTDLALLLQSFHSFLVYPSIPKDLQYLVSPDHANAPPPNLDPPPSFLREISTSASWTVSSSKPGCSIPQLRHPSTALFWQSDGPQPHYLNIHFFKLVRIAGLRLYLDFEQDESYTPTRIIFLAGSGMNDLQEWGEMRLESPRGWVWADFSGVGDPDSDEEDDEDDEEEPPRRIMPPPSPAVGMQAIDASSDSENNAPRPPLVPAISDDAMQLDPQIHTPVNHFVAHTPQDLRRSGTPSLARPTPRLPFTALSPNAAPKPTTTEQRRQPKMPVLRAHLVQIKILENHQNGKDTHLRGLQIFARNDEEVSRSPVRGVAPVTSKTIAGGVGAEMQVARKDRAPRRIERMELGGGSRSAWDVEPSIR